MNEPTRTHELFNQIPDIFLVDTAVLCNWEVASAVRSDVE
jgi:hypothetical protein